MKTVKFLKIMKARFNVIPFLMMFGILIFTSCENEDETMPDAGVKNIVEVAAEAGQFGLLIEAAQKAGLVDVLSTGQGLTVFAPTDDAFATLFSELGVSGIDEIDATTLASVLTYHVVGQVAYSNQLRSGAIPSLNTASPDQKSLSLLVNVGSEVMINNAKVTAADVMASNGVIHVIDKVLLPPSVVDIAMFSSDFSSLVSAVVKAQLAETLSCEGPFTVFAPTNDAFAALFSALGISGLDEVWIEDLTSILTYHVVGDNILSSELSAGSVNALSGDAFQVTIDGGVMLNGTIKVVATDIQGTNGVVHVIDKVLLPQ